MFTNLHLWMRRLGVGIAFHCYLSLTLYMLLVLAVSYRVPIVLQERGYEVDATDCDV